MTKEERARQLFEEGYNCAQAVLAAFAPELGMDEKTAAKLASGFGGGIGHARDLCGAMAGCVMVISTLAGRNQPSDKPLAEIYPLTLEFHERFAKEFGSCTCGDLMPYEFNTREHLKNCLKLVNKVAQLLAVYLEEKELLK